MERCAIYAAIDRERTYQDWKRRPQQRPVAEWLLILRRELNEAMDDWTLAGDDRAALVELLQVAAVAVACIEQHGIVERVYPIGMEAHR